MKVQPVWWRRKLGPLPFWGWLAVIFLAAGAVEAVVNPTPPTQQATIAKPTATTVAAQSTNPPIHAMGLIIPATVSPSVAQPTNTALPPTATSEPPTPVPPTNTTAPPTPTSAPTDQLKALAIKEAITYSLADKTQPISITFMPNNGRYDLTMKFQLENNIVNLGDVFKLGTFNTLKALYTSGLPLGSADLTATFPVQDSYGNNLPNYTVARAILSYSEASQFNWQNITQDQAETHYDKLYLDPVITK